MSARSKTGGGFYQAVWRWHFYAGLIVLPVLLWMAITGALYLYKPEIERLVYADWSHVTPKDAPQPLSEMIATVERESGQQVSQIQRPAEPTASWRMTLQGADGTRRLAFVDPYRGMLLGTTKAGGVMQTVRDLHSLIITGPVGNALVEIVAGWAILLVLSGLYLWWPRRGSPVVGLRGQARGRLFWRDLHASTGLLAGGVILFLAITGLPWSGFAGKQLQGWVARAELGRPKAPGPNPWEAPAPRSHDGHGHDEGAKQSLPWSMQEATPPAASGNDDIGVDRAAEIAGKRGLAAPWTLTLPMADGAPYLISQSVRRAQDARAIYVDPASGAVMQDARFAHFGIGARAIEWGIATHQGQQYGEINRTLMLLGCLALMLLCLTAPVLWWKRRKNGRLEAPARPADPRNAQGVAAIMLAIGLCLPLTGLTLAAALALDMLMGRWRSRAAMAG
ncbi:MULTISPECIES: PepSY-associated TM helix domain-containing protein [unclassified Sphingobium]|uniref:PepSY-associated TM helix domain-containing protein n=1 Tax=unclassified Sphingobium TaxID=2611147 RepID=UPI0022258BA6|nr:MULTISPECIES: PepSY domain-containing protein [unclassified Sphingobium]MCW2396735.1 putative iron-regulated membrane protein [Sphingobium sp. B8D3B]MCW2420252.1 putative iron-regulated membrane protein [Sphingobium sp. B8D3C]